MAAVVLPVLRVAALLSRFTPAERAAPMALAWRISVTLNTDVRCVFTVTTGRSGTKYLTQILALHREVISLHEPDPSFVLCMRAAQADPSIASRFLTERKLPAIRAAASRSVYIETSHLFCKGFLDAWLDSDLPTPDLILLDRDHRATALSLERLATIPGRTESGRRWYLAPDDPTVLLTLPGWTALSDYQLCYWYCLEIEERKRLYGPLIEARGCTVVRVDVDAIKSLACCWRLLRSLRLSRTRFRWIRYLRTRSTPRNLKKSVPKPAGTSPSAESLQALEQEVIERIVRQGGPSACSGRSD